MRATVMRAYVGVNRYGFPYREQLSNPRGAAAAGSVERTASFRNSKLELRNFFSRPRCLERPRDQLLRLALQTPQMLHARKALGVNLVDIFRARRTRRKP